MVLEQSLEAFVYYLYFYQSFKMHHKLKIIQHIFIFQYQTIIMHNLLHYSPYLILIHLL
jgi:hypothetical protein